MRKMYFSELSRRLREEGLETSLSDTQKLNVLLRGQPVLYVSSTSDVFLLPAGSQNKEARELCHQVAVVADEVYGYVEAMENASPLRASGLHEDFRLLADFGGAVLAGRERENGRGYQFVTWVWVYERQGVCHGHYFEDDFQSAKQDFAVRSGLISKAQLFSPEQLAELYRATDFLLEEGPAPDEKHLRAIQEARTKIEYTVLNLQTRLEQTQIQEPQMNL